VTARGDQEAGATSTVNHVDFLLGAIIRDGVNANISPFPYRRQKFRMPASVGVIEIKLSKSTGEEPSSFAYLPRRVQISVEITRYLVLQYTIIDILDFMF